MTASVEKAPVAFLSRQLLGPSLRPGGNITLSLPRGVVTVSLDHVGDWTITIGLPAGSDKTVSLAERLIRTGFFHAAESEGVSYFLWTTAFEKTLDARRTAEQVLSNALRTMEDASLASRYIS